MLLNSVLFHINQKQHINRYTCYLVNFTDAGNDHHPTPTTFRGARHHVSKDVFQDSVINFLDIIGDGFLKFIYCEGIAAINFVFHSAPKVKV